MCWTFFFISTKRQKPSSILLKFICSFTSSTYEEREKDRERKTNWKEDKSRRSWNGFALAKCDVFLKGNDIQYTHSQIHMKKNVHIYTLYRIYSVIIMVHHSSMCSLSCCSSSPHTCTIWTGSFKWIGKNVLLCVSLHI